MHYQTLTVNAKNGKTYWQKPQQTAEDAVLYAMKRTRNVADIFIYEVPEEEEYVKLVKTILHEE